MEESYSFKPIGHVRSCFTEKFGIPRQPGLVPDASATIEMLSPFDQSEAFRQLESFSHVWIIFVFHRCLQERWRATVRPPRLGGNQRVGVFASRSGFRPNPIGQSVVTLGRIETGQAGTRVHVSGVDLLDGTPVLDIKPYLPYSDSRADARAGYAAHPPDPRRAVRFSNDARATCRLLERSGYPRLGRLISDLLALDPRPGYQAAASRRTHGMRLWEINIRFQVEAEAITVTAIEPPE